jgi:hypothetical protein
MRADASVPVCEAPETAAAPPFVRWRRALPAALLVHALRSAFALSVAMPWAGAVAPPPSAAESARVGLLVLVSRLLNEAGDHPARHFAAPLVGWLALSPWALSFLLSATQRAGPLAQHARRAMACYPRALALWLGCAGYAAGLLLLAAAAVHLAGYAVAHSHDARLDTLVALAVATPFSLALLHPLTLLDTSQRALLAGRPSLRFAVRAGLRDATLRRVAWRALYGAAAIAIYAAAGGLPRAALGFGGALGVLLLSQLLAVPATLLRLRWLAGLGAATAR